MITHYNPDFVTWKGRFSTFAQGSWWESEGVSPGLENVGGGAGLAG